jgi:hypothetical protein
MSLTKVSYSMINGAYLNVLDYGAFNDGTNANATTAAIQAAIDDLGLAGGILYFPVGTYSINSTITTPSNSFGITLLGSGLRTTFLKWTGGASTMIFAHNGTDNFTMQAFALENTGTGTIAVQLNSVRCNIIDVFTNPTVAWSNTIFSTVSTIASYNYKVTFDNVNLFVSAGTVTAQADYAIKLGSGHSVTIQNSMFSGFAESAVFRDITVDTNVLNGLSITGTRFESFSGTSISYPGSVNAIGVNLQYSTGVSITGSNFEMAGDQVGSENQIAIYIGTDVDGCTISGNYFGAQGRCDYCVYVAANSADAISIDANEFSRVVLEGIGAASLLALAKIQVGNNIAELGPEIIVDNTFTPTVTIGGASTGITFSAQDGRFIRYGKNLTYQVSVTLTSKGALTGAVRIGGLPIGANSALTLPDFVGSVWTLNLTTPLALTALIPKDGSTSIKLFKTDGTELQNTDITNTSSFIVQVTVLTA